MDALKLSTRRSVGVDASFIVLRERIISAEREGRDERSQFLIQMRSGVYSTAAIKKCNMRECDNGSERVYDDNRLMIMHSYSREYAVLTVPVDLIANNQHLLKNHGLVHKLKD
eukprot:scaffold38182_cov161-Skeletonema_dohrnii-CCMP3373.AAC.2